MDIEKKRKGREGERNKKEPKKKKKKEKKTQTGKGKTTRAPKNQQKTTTNRLSERGAHSSPVHVEGQYLRVGQQPESLEKGG